MGIQNDIEQTELTIEHTKELIEKREAAYRLADNPDFKKLVLDGYIRDEAARLAHLLNEPTFTDEQREFVTKDVYGPGALKRYFQTTIMLGNNAEATLEEHEESLAELRLMEDDPDAYGEEV